MYYLNLESDFDLSSKSAYAVLLRELVLSVFTSPGILQLTICTLYRMHTIQITLNISATELLILNSHQVELLLTANIMYTLCHHYLSLTIIIKL